MGANEIAEKAAAPGGLQRFRTAPAFMTTDGPMVVALIAESPTARYLPTDKRSLRRSIKFGIQFYKKLLQGGRWKDRPIFRVSRVKGGATFVRAAF